MVIRDLSDDERRAQMPSRELPLAFPGDRFLAAVFDFLIFSPVVSFCVAGFLKQIKTYLLLDPQSAEAGIVWVLFMLSAVGLAVFFQAIFLYFWQATPGQRFLKMKVVSYPHPATALRFSQCLLRSAGWVGSVFVFGVPFLDILGHPLRRAFYERASDTLVVTEKREHDDGPLVLESRFVGSWMRMFFLMVFASGLIYALQTYHLVQIGRFAAATEKQKNWMCSQVPEEVPFGDRADQAIAMFMMDQVTADCLDKEADFALWNASQGDQAWAYLAKGVATDDQELRKQYFAKVCESGKKSETCGIADYLTHEDDGAVLRRHGLASVTSRVLLLDKVLEQKNDVAAVVLIEDLRKQAPLREALEKRYVRAVWAINENLRESRGRQPASSEARDIVHEFKEKYGVR